MMLATALCFSVFLTLSSGLNILDVNLAIPKILDVKVDSHVSINPITKLLDSGASSLVRSIIKGLLGGLTLPEILLQIEIGSHHLGCNASTCRDYDKCRNTTVADIVILIDSSASVGSENWSKLIGFVANFTKNFPLGKSNVRFAAITYSYAPVSLFNLIKYTDQSCIEKSLKKARFLNAQTMTYKAYDYIRKQKVFDAEAGGRPFAPDVVVLFIHAQSSSTNRTITAGQMLRDSGVRIIGVGISPEAPVNELYPVVQSPQDVILASDFDNLYQIEKKLVRRICEEQLRPITPDIVTGPQALQSDHTEKETFTTTSDDVYKPSGAKKLPCFKKCGGKINSIFGSL